MSIGYDLIGDLHGHLGLLRKLCERLGYSQQFTPPPNRRMIFVGDLATRGPENLATLLTVRSAVLDGRAYAVLGNHDDTLLRWLRDGESQFKNKLADVASEIRKSPNPNQLRADLKSFLEMLPLILRLDEGRLVVVHAGIEEPMLDRPISSEDRRFVLNGDAIGKSLEGRTLRRDWAADYRGAPFVVYGHTPDDEASIRFNTINVDSGVYRSGRLTAFRWPERQIVSVTARD